MKVIRLESEFKSLVRKADEICIAVAMLTDYGLHLFDYRDEGCDLKILVGYDLPTRPSALQKLINDDISAKVYDVQNHFFHPKLYLFRVNEEWTAFIGSGNCSKGGLVSNIELSFKIDDQDAVADILEDWFNKYYNLGTILTQEWLDQYRLFFEQRTDYEKEIRVITKQFKNSTGVIKGEVALDKYDFTGQFFKFEHYDAFTAPKPILDEPGPVKERLQVRNKLEALHAKIYPLIKEKGWEVYPHHKPQHLTSSFQHNQFAENSLTAIWLHYGRSEPELERYKKEYVDNMTSLYHMRLEILIGRGSLFTELRVGKKDGSYLDREYIKNQLKTNPNFVQRYFECIKNLDKDFYIIINGETVPVREFNESEQLKEFTLQDQPKYYYFSIGRKYRPDDKAISQNNIVATVINDFEKLYPLYQLFKHRF